MFNVSSRLIALISLGISVASLSIGLSSFADELSISGEAVLRKSDAFDAKVRFDATSLKCTYDDANKTAITDIYNSGYITSDDNWSGISVPLVNEENKKSIICSAKIENGSSYLAYLTGLATTNNVLCEAADPINDPVSNLTEVCGVNNANITITVAIGNDINSSDKIVLHKTPVSLDNPVGTIEALNGQVKGENTAWIKFAYTGNTEPDGTIKITIPMVAVNYSTVRSS